MRHIGAGNSERDGTMERDSIDFVKMNGLGNKIIVADMRHRADRISPQAARQLAADEKTSFDQIMAVHAPKSAGMDARIHILNSDGSDAEACGNGTRCVVSWLHGILGKNDFVFETAAGRIDASYASDEMISVDMGVPRFGWEQIPLSEEFADTRTIELQIGPIDKPLLHTPSVANIGNPHAIFWVEDDPWDYELDRFGPLLENHPIFPERANISIARITAKNAVTIRTWERGAGLTKACGSAACATLVSGVRTDRLRRKSVVTVPGGELAVEWQENNHIIMSGPVAYEFYGILNPQTGAWTVSRESA